MTLRHRLPRTPLTPSVVGRNLLRNCGPNIVDPSRVLIPRILEANPAPDLLLGISIAVNLRELDAIDLQRRRQANADQELILSLPLRQTSLAVADMSMAVGIIETHRLARLSLQIALILLPAQDQNQLRNL